MNILETDRLILRKLNVDDAAFILELLNTPAWWRFIGDRGVRTLEDARAYILGGPMTMYAKHGFGLYLTALKQEHTSIGLCGLIKRDTLEDVDIGFAFLPQFWAQGYAFEAANATLNYGKNSLGLKRIVAITSPDNITSAKLLNKLGLQFSKMLKQTPTSPEVCLFEPVAD